MNHDMDWIIDINDDSDNRITNDELNTVVLHNQKNMTFINASFTLGDYVLYKNIFDKYISPNSSCVHAEFDLNQYLKFTDEIRTFKEKHNLSKPLKPKTFSIYSRLGSLGLIGIDEHDKLFLKTIEKLKLI